ncbi:major capsid protein [Amycolatopsis sp. NPDC059657]|uniref:major capsid protein n=1 Tax=Amycolatopsis sp. NPDC059657 TaxID=3346899 RepID=UPI00366A7883
MDIFNEYITPAQLTGYARAALADRPENAFRLAQYMPYREVNDLVYRYDKGAGGLLEAANYRAYDAEPGFGSREGIERVTGELPPIGQQYVLGEYDTLRLRANADQAIRDLFLRDAERIARQIQTRLEFARADALVNGSVTIAEKGVQATVSFNRSGSHSVSAAIAWSDHTNATVIDDLQTWADTYTTTNGERPGTILTSTTVINHMLRNKQVGLLVYPLATTVPGQVTLLQLNQVLQDFDLPTITRFDAQAKRNGVAQRFIPADKLLFLPANGSDMGATLWGTTAESLEPEYGIAANEQPGIVVGAFKQKETPVRVFTIGSAIALPILAQPDLSFVADVI